MHAEDVEWARVRHLSQQHCDLPTGQGAVDQPTSGGFDHVVDSGCDDVEAVALCAPFELGGYVVAGPLRCAEIVEGVLSIVALVTVLSVSPGCRWFGGCRVAGLAQLGPTGYRLLRVRDTLF